MSDAKITLIGLYNYRPDLFDLCVFPSGVDKNTAVDVIIANNAEFEPLYWDGDYMKNIIGVWSKKWYRTIEKWQNALNVKYDPLNNYDRYEEYDDVKENTGTNSTTAKDDQKVSAYNSNTLQPTSENNHTDTTNGSGTETIKHRAHLYGNIGVTTSQQMLEAELDVAKWNLYDEISELFKTELLVTVY